eukprot:TRINITY_DN43886_c0_g1_i1.p1 TRINITY_DN43886_c0_g1~~TRINITY_DN43886_c0_g1_i1.p1  ORF type:complete len:925 (+),score=140.49 TRINITY_DN43886_c0_g1_i1:59-2776(+)
MATGNFRTKNTRLPKSPEQFATEVLEHHAQPEISGLKHKVTKKLSKALPFLRPEGRIVPRNQIDQSLMAHEEVVHGLLQGSADSASPEMVQQQLKTGIQRHMLQTRMDEELEDRLDGKPDGNLDSRDVPWHKQQLYPRRWYDGLVPFNLPFENRETVAEARNRLRVLGDAAAWRTECNAKPAENTAKAWGTAVFWLVIMTLAILPVVERSRMVGAASAECYNPHTYTKGCNVIPYPKLPYLCAFAIILIFKLSTLDMTVGPYGALPLGLSPNEGRAASLRFVKQASEYSWPRAFSGAVPESERDGIYGYLEQGLAIWHSCLGATAIAILILLVDFGRRMQDGFALSAMTGHPLKHYEVILAQPGTLDDTSIDIDRCLAVHTSQITQVSSEIFGMRNLVLFMAGAVIFGMGDLFKVRAIQLWPMKGLLSMDFIMRITKPWIWNPHVGALNKKANECAEKCWEQHEKVRLQIEVMDEIGSFQKAAKQPSEQPIHDSIEELCNLAMETADQLTTSLTKQHNVGYLNRARILWAAAFQTAGISLWVPASSVNISPCLHENRRWSLTQVLVGNAVDRMEIFAFGCMCVLLAVLLFLAYMPFVPMDLQSMMSSNPNHWHFNFPFVKSIYARMYPAKHWLGFIVDGLLMVFILNAVVFGQLGSPWVDPPQDRTWLYINPWALWKVQVGLYVLEISARWIGTNIVKGRGVVRPSLAEDAAYTAQVQAKLLDVLMQVGQSGGPFHDVQNLLGTVSAKIRQKVFDSNKATKFESSSESEEGEPLNGWTKMLVPPKTDIENPSAELAKLEDSPHARQIAQTIFPGDEENESAPEPEVLQEFIVDNRWLGAKTDGLGFRKTKDYEDHDFVRPVAPWYSSVFGFDEGDGWVRLEDGSYLPSYVNDQPVLTAPMDDEQP